MVIPLILTGLFLMVAMQVAIFCVAITKSPGSALLCLVIPFFVYVYAKKNLVQNHFFGCGISV